MSRYAVSKITFSKGQPCQRSNVTMPCALDVMLQRDPWVVVRRGTLSPISSKQLNAVDCYPSSDVGAALHFETQRSDALHLRQPAVSWRHDKVSSLHNLPSVLVLRVDGARHLSGLRRCRESNRGRHKATLEGECNARGIDRGGELELNKGGARRGGPSLVVVGDQSLARSSRRAGGDTAVSLYQ